MELIENYYTVDQLNKAVKNVLESNSNFKDIWIKGEISNFTNHTQSGHYYFSLKENNCAVKAVMFSFKNKYLKFVPKNGMKVFAKVKVTVFEQGGNYQVNVSEMQVDGIGDLHMQFEQLKEKLTLEGHLDPKIKKEIPIYPKSIGIVTSPTGAVIQDMITTIQRRYPLVKIKFFPVSVQGDKAIPSIISGIETFNKLNNVDVLIVGRGGGSVEDLWCFNSEEVARAIINSNVPIISAVGHETDFTIADFVADVRAPTPTAAAEIATKITYQDLQINLSNLNNNLNLSLQNKLKFAEERLKKNIQFLKYHHPEKIFEENSQKLDFLSNKMVSLLENKISNSENKLDKLKTNLLSSMEKLMVEKSNKLSLIISNLDNLSPLKTINRGFGVVSKDEKVIKNVTDVKVGETLNIKLQNGSLTTNVIEIKEEK